MSSFVDELADAAAGATSVWHQFVVSHNHEEDAWYAFVEGKLDVTYYSSALRAHFSHSQVYGFRCEGKDGVLRARSDVRKTHPHCTRCIFFVDKDLDDILNPDRVPASADIYVTSAYSIENDLTTPEAFDVVWRDLWNLPVSDPRYAVVKRRYVNGLSRMYRILIPIMAWVVLTKKAGERPNVNNVRIGDVVQLVDGEPHLRAAPLATLVRHSSCRSVPQFHAWLALARELRSHPPREVGRGKFIMWYFCAFLEFASRLLETAPGPRPERVIPCAPEAIARSMIGKVPPPHCLRSFLGALPGTADTHCRRTDPVGGA